MKTPEEKYRNDPVYHSLVDHLEHMADYLNHQAGKENN